MSDMKSRLETFKSRVCTVYVNRAVLTGSCVGRKRETKSFLKDCIIHAVDTDPSPIVIVDLKEIFLWSGRPSFKFMRTHPHLVIF